MLEVKVESDFFFRRRRMNSHNEIKEHRNLYNIPKFQAISWNSQRDIYRLKHYIRKRAS